MTTPDRLQRVCGVEDIPEGQGRMFRIGETMIGVFRTGGQFYAIENECPHAGASLAHGTVEGDTVRCRIHHWRLALSRRRQTAVQCADVSRSH